MDKKLGENVVEQEKSYKLEDIVFFSKKRVQAFEEYDVYISLLTIKPLKNGCDKRLSISFRDTIGEAFKNNKYLLIGVVDDRLYFKPIDTSVGYKIQKCKYTKKIICNCTKEQVILFGKFAG